MQFYKPGNRTVVAFLDIIGKITGGQLVIPPMIGYTFTTHALPGTRFITAVTPGLIDLLLAFRHVVLPV